MNSLTIPFEEGLALPEQAAGRIHHFLWLDNGYRPETVFSLVYNREGLRVHLAAAEPSLTVQTDRDNGPVWEDNCLEFFFAPFDDEADYINFECNPLGAMIIEKGAARAPRTLLTGQLKPLLGLSTRIQPGVGWAVDYTIPFRAIAEIYGRPFRPMAGGTFRFNAYCCGDHTAFPHFGAWSPVLLPEPDFHQSAFFGRGVWG